MGLARAEPSRPGCRYSCIPCRSLARRSSLSPRHTLSFCSPCVGPRTSIPPRFPPATSNRHGREPPPLPATTVAHPIPPAHSNHPDPCEFSSRPASQHRPSCLVWACMRTCRPIGRNGLKHAFNRNPHTSRSMFECRHMCCRCTSHVGTLRKATTSFQAQVFPGTCSPDAWRDRFPNSVCVCVWVMSWCLPPKWRPRRWWPCAGRAAGPTSGSTKLAAALRTPYRSCRGETSWRP